MRYTRYFCGEYEEVISQAEKEKFEAKYSSSTSVSFEPLFDGRLYRSRSDSIAAQIDAFGWKYEDERRKTEPGGPGPMSADKLRRILRNCKDLSFDRLNFYYAWKTPDNTLFMLGTMSNQIGEVITYQYDPYSKDYTARFISLPPLNGCLKKDILNDPIEKLASQVESYEFIGSWHNPEYLMDDSQGLGKVLACGQWNLAQERILNTGKEKPLSEQIALAEASVNPSVSYSRDALDMPELYY